MKQHYLLLAALFILVFSSCGKFQEVTFSGLEGMKLIKLSEKGVEAEITARIKNPNKTAFTIYKSDMDVTVNGMNVGKAHLDNNVKIKKNSEESYIFNIKTDFSNLSITDIPKVIGMAMSRSVTIGIKGKLKAGKLFMKREFPVDMTQNVPLDLHK